ncbi:MAG: M48 family metallopeptidase [Intestinibacter sp.]|uniref:M48 family metallopeptidase n=1 Tax=Intestinibacter sp. TaxID=1965304 RepID=UPI002A7F4D59|nr:M48 family metallopeptidase [Intestinibacter sp.]MDY4576059.1 M48 family metallopeptidase [Intestinibacter sp.]
MEGLVLKSIIVKVLERDDLNEFIQLYNFEEDVIKISNRYSINEILSLEKNITLNQKVTLYTYIFLYKKLKNINNSKNRLIEIAKEFNLEDSVYENCTYFFNKDRLNYIRMDYNKKNLKLYNVLIEVDDYISNLVTKVVSVPIRKNKKNLVGLKSREYEHIDDARALENFRNNKNIEKVVRLYIEYDIERISKIQYTGSNILVTQENIPYLYDALCKVCEILDVKKIPKLYVKQGFINACTIGCNDPIIVVDSACLSLLDYDELLFILGHEVGHIKSEHVLYHNISQFLPIIASIVGNVTLGLGELALQGVSLLMYNWYRKSEFTADRAGLLACQNIDAAISTMTKLAGFPYNFYDSINSEMILKQATDFEELDNSKYNKIMKYLSIMNSDHPWTVLRAKELKSWYDNGEYKRILNRNGNNQITSNQINYVQKFCTQCGSKLKPTAKFCTFCGERV